MRDLNLDIWNSDQADTQFQGEEMSHELASLLLTECIQYSLYNSCQPIFALYLDAKSAFDVVIRQLLIKNLYFCGTSLASVAYIDNRLKYRNTYIDWEKTILGPVFDEKGLEQGGVSSSDYYKIYGKEQLENAQKSGLGVIMRNLTISAIGQADDTVLLANNIHDLGNLLDLTLNFCSRHHVEICPEKTKLQAFCNKSKADLTKYQIDTTTLVIDGEAIKFADNVEHVGVIRSIHGNLPNIQERIAAHKRAIGSILYTGMARNHRGNPAASIRINKIYGIPVLLSGLASLVLKETEVDLIDQHVKINIEKLLRLPASTPRPVVFFLSGTLPGRAQLHIRQLSLFGMITRLPDKIIFHHAVNTLVASKPSCKSWFHGIRQLCLMYDLPHPLTFLEEPRPKTEFKSLIRSKVVNYWEQKLRAQAEALSSLEYFRPNYMSLLKPHPIYLAAGSSPYEISKSTVQAKMLSGRYRTGKLCRHWSTNTKGFCLAPTCTDLEILEDLTHILAKCEALASTRSKLLTFSLIQARPFPPEVFSLVTTFCNPSHPYFVSFLLDCSHFPEVISLVQCHGQDILSILLHITRTWCYSLHRERLVLLNRWRKF